MSTSSVVMSVAVAVQGQGWEPGYGDGWNGESATPHMGWRSWNSFGACISAGIPGDQSNCSFPKENSGQGQGVGSRHACKTCGTIASAIDGVTVRKWKVAGKTISLADVGYSSVGIDEGWEGCGLGFNHTQHDQHGNPVINPFRFPDMKKLVEYGHSKGVSMGWYLNGCACGEAFEHDINYEGDIRQLHALGFDAAKFDGCGVQRNATKYAALMQATGRNYSIENCHWGQNGPISCYDGDDGSACPSLDWCPFNWYRTGNDINTGPDSWFSNLQDVRQFTDPDKPLSRPGCWAYPDMLEVGMIMKPNADRHAEPELDMPWNRAHFGAWCVVSAPLVLGIDPSSPDLAKVIDIVTHDEAIAVNQQWAGHPGMVLVSDDPNAHPDAAGFIKRSGAIPEGGMFKTPSNDIRAANLTIAEAETWCNGNGSCYAFTFESSVEKEIYPVYFKAGGGNNFDKEWTTYVKAARATPSSTTQQIWGKPQPGGAWAILYINAHPNHTMDTTLPFSKLKIAGSRSMTVRDIWARKDLGPTGHASFTPPPVLPRDSGFYLLTPVAAPIKDHPGAETEHAPPDLTKQPEY